MFKATGQHSDETKDENAKYDDRRRAGMWVELMSAGNRSHHPSERHTTIRAQANLAKSIDR